jgi:deoxyribose-phosphate aldolase
MLVTAKEIAKMIDLSCVRTISNKADIEEMVNAARKYGFGQVSVLQCFIPYTKQLLKGASDIHVVGNVSFPSGSDSTSLKVVQAKEMVAAGCDEIDMVMNIGKLRSGELKEVESDVRAVVETVHPLPAKVIIEIMYLTPLRWSRLAAYVCAPEHHLLKQVQGGQTAERPLRTYVWSNRLSATGTRSKLPVVSAIWIY